MGSSNEPAWRQAINHMLHFSFILKAEIEAKLYEEVGIGLADHEGLINLRTKGGSLRMTDIADRLVLSRGGITKLVDRLEDAGYVRRTSSTDDRRVTMVEITEAGSALVVRSRALIDEVIVKRWASKITEDEADLVKTLIRRVYHDEHSGLVED